MIQLPPVPDWNRLHPLVVHFPTAILLVAPLFVILGAVVAPPRDKPFLASALIIMVISTISLFVALQTGETASELVGRTAQVKEVLKLHDSLAETTCLLFSVLTVVFAHLLVLPKILRRELSRTLSASLLAAFLILYATGALFLVNTGHQGGRMVHELGVDAQISVSTESVALPSSCIPEESARN